MKEQEVKARIPRKNKLKLILLLIFIVLFKNIIWDVYIVNPTVEDALDGLEGEAGIGTFLNQKSNLTLKPFGEGFKIYGISKGYWGWTVTDEEFVEHHGENKAFEVTEKIFHYKQKKDVTIILITTQDKKIDQIIAYSKHTEPIVFNRTHNGDTQLYYTYSEKPVEEVIYKATSKDGVVLYTQ